MPIHKGLYASTIVAGALAGNSHAAEPRTQPISLQDCIELALQHNLDLQIERRNPARAALDIDIARWGYYDPGFSLGGQTTSRSSGERFNPDVGITIPGQTTDTDSFNASLGGILPYTGLQYSLRGNASATESQQGANYSESSFASTSIVLTQPLLKNFWIDSGRLNLTLSKNNLRIAELTLQRSVMDLITQVETAYHNLIFTFESVQVQEAALTLANRSLEETRKRFEVGTVAELETKQTESQVAAREADLLTARRNLDIQQNVLKRLISDNYLEVHELVLQPTETLSASKEVLDVHLSWDRGLTQRPDLLISQIDVESMGLQLKYDRNQLLPQLDVFGSYGRGGSSPFVIDYGESFDRIRRGDEPNHSFGASISFPLSNRAARSRYRSNKLREEQLLLGLKSQEQGIMIEIDNAIKQAASSYDRVQATRKASEYALAALEAEQKKLENGKSTSFVVLQLQNDLTSARSAELRAVADYNNALAELSFREATTFERHNINWEVEKDLK